MQPLLASQFPVDLTLLVLRLQLTLRFGLIPPLLLRCDLITGLLGLLGEVILLLLLVLIDLLDFSIEVLLLSSESLKLFLICEVCFNHVLEGCELLILSHLFHHLLQLVGELGLVRLDELLVATDVGVVLQLSAQFTG